MIQIKYTKTTKTHAKNELAIIQQAEYDNKTMQLAFSITNYLCQGLEYSNKVFIVMDRLFEDNMLYVCLSRAKNAEQIYLVNVSHGSKICNAEMNIKKKLNKYKNDDKAKGFMFDLDIEYVMSLRKEQNDKCKHCNADMLFENYSPFSMKQFSVDRIDDTKGHTKDNVVLSCFGCNCRHKKTEDVIVSRDLVNQLVNKIPNSVSNTPGFNRLLGYCLYNIGIKHNLELMDIWESYTGKSTIKCVYMDNGLHIGSLVMWSNGELSHKKEDLNL
jgi:hypothetical protein